jgi:transcriptional regulator with XRE-family HTH domain
MLKASRESKQQFANRVKTLRAQRSIKATALAKTAGVSPASVWQWEHAGAVPRKATLVKLADALHVSPDYLLKGSRTAPPTASAPSISPVASLDDASLEDLIKAIRIRGFKVVLETI